MRVLFHIDDDSNWKMTLGNVNNMINAGKQAGEDFDIEVLSNGNSVVSLKKQAAINLKFYDLFDNLSKHGVVFAACNNSLNNYAIEKEELMSFIKVVPAGVVELAKKQQEGYAYIKP